MEPGLSVPVERVRDGVCDSSPGLRQRGLDIGRDQRRACQ